MRHDLHLKNVTRYGCLRVFVFYIPPTNIQVPLDKSVENTFLFYFSFIFCYFFFYDNSSSRVISPTLFRVLTISELYTCLTFAVGRVQDITSFSYWLASRKFALAHLSSPRENANFHFKTAVTHFLSQIWQNRQQIRGLRKISRHET